MDAPNPVTELISCFDGLRPMLAAIGETSPNLIQHWEKSARIPHYRELQIVSGAERAGVTISSDLLARLFPERRQATDTSNSNSVAA